METQPTKKVKFATLGCRLNQYETQAVREQFLNMFYEETQKTEEADVVVINTCTVTNESDRESRYLIRKFHRENPSARIVVTGCYVERDRNAVAGLPGVVLTAGNQEKAYLADLLEQSCASLGDHPLQSLSKRRFSNLSISHFDGRTRAHIKIQDGCNHACSFCKVVLVRGPSRSRPLSDVVEEARRLCDQGTREVVLTGIQLGAYGKDLDKRQMLVPLIEALTSIPGLLRIRLSSIEPIDVTEELIDAMAVVPQICPHLHIPLQSGADEILKFMNRRYDSGFFKNLILKIKSKVADFVLTTDVMVGFPGETDDHFEQTCKLLSIAKPYKLHVFPYSRREGTKAARLYGETDGTLVRNRKHRLFLLEQDLREEVQKSFLSRTVQVLIEDDKLPNGWLSGRSGHYLKVKFPSSVGRSGDVFHVQIERIEGEDLIGCAANGREGKL